MDDRRGQSLLEVLIAAALGAVFVTTSIVLIAPILKGSSSITRTQVGAALGQELMENVRVLAESDWYAVARLTTSTVNYYLQTTSSPFTVATGTQDMMIATTTYTRYFFVSDVGRDGGGAIVTSGGSTDPSVKKITVAYGPSGSATSSLATYVTRFVHKVFFQTDWSEGALVGGVATSAVNTFTTSSNVNGATTTGAIILNL